MTVTHLFLQTNAFSHSLTSFNPVSSVDASAVGAQIFTSWSRPLVAKTGRWGWGSRQFTWFGRKESSGSGVHRNRVWKLQLPEPNSCHDLAWKRPTYLPEPRPNSSGYKISLPIISNTDEGRPHPQEQVNEGPCILQLHKVTEIQCITSLTPQSKAPTFPRLGGGGGGNNGFHQVTIMKKKNPVLPEKMENNYIYLGLFTKWRMGRLKRMN